jgi:sugar/nucleoside kinase (ribokinase family)
MNILSLGDLLLDVVIRYDPTTGEADTAPDAVQLWPGGSAANFAVWAARGGANVGFISQAGRDWAGDMLVRSLEAEGVTPYVRVVDDTPTGRVLVMVDPDGVRRMWSYPGASAAIDADDIDPAWFEDLHAFHLTGYSFLREGPRAAAHRALDLARRNGSTLCTLDPNPPHLISDFGPALYRDLLRALQFDILFPNLEEGALLTGDTDPQRIACDLLELSPLVVLTLGHEGCLIAREAGSAPDAPAVVTALEAAPIAKVLDTTGAGDAFAAGFMIEYLRTRDPLTAAHAANRIAATVVSRVGAR